MGYNECLSLTVHLIPKIGEVMDSWIPLALLSPSFLGAVNILDKLAVDRLKNPLRWTFYVGCVEIFIWVVVASCLVRFSDLMDLTNVETTVVGLGIGVLRGLSLILMVKALRIGNVSNVVAIWSLNPIFVALGASFFLGEIIPTVAWAAILLAVFGAFSVSWAGSISTTRLMDLSIAVLALTSGLGWASSNLLAKFILTDQNIWNVYILSRIGISVTLISLGIFKNVRYRALVAWKDRYLVMILVLAELIANVGLAFNFLAINLGPVSLVSAVLSIQPMVVLIYSVGLALILPWKFGTWINQQKFLQQLFGIICIVCGIAWIALT